MPDESAKTETIPSETAKSDETKEPQGTEETDWKSQARKWEQRAKDNKKDLDKLQELLDGYESKQKDEEAKEKTASEALEAAKAEIKRLKAEAERDQLAREVAKASGVDAEVLVRMRGDTREEIEENAKLLASSSKVGWPEVKDRGASKSPGMTLDEILAIKNPKKQLEAAMKNPHAFD